MWGSQGWNQWALQPAMFNDVPHEQIDWAALAKQWIQMQQTPPDATAPVPAGLPAVSPPAPSTTAPSIIPPLPPSHGPVVPEDFTADVMLKPPIAPGVMPEPFQTDQPFEADLGGFVPKPSNNFWNKPQWEVSAASDVDDRIWPGPAIEPASGLIAGKETYDYGHMHDNPPLAMQSIDYNHMSEFSYNQVYPEAQYEQYWSQVNAAPPISPMFLKKHHTSSSSKTSSSHPTEEDPVQIDAAKRKQLPAWIREGLEKMEQERLKKLEKERAEKEKAEKLAEAKLKTNLNFKDDGSLPTPAKSKFDSDSDSEEADIIHKKESVLPQRSPSPIEDTRTEEEKRQEYVLNIRRILTEILLTVTNAEMYAVAEEVLRKEKLKARQLASTASLTSVASGLCSLANYGTESEASEAEEDKDATDSEEELHRRIREKKKLFAIKEKKIIAELERKEIEEQNEALQTKNENMKSFENKIGETESNLKKIEPPNSNAEAIHKIFLPPSDASDQICLIPFIEDKADVVENSDNATTSKELKKSNDKNSQSPNNSTSGSSNSESESSDKDKKKSNDHDGRNSEKCKGRRKDKSPKKHRRHRSSDSDSSDHHRKSRSRDKASKKSSSYKKKKKYKRSDSSSSSSSSSRRRKYSSKSEPSRRDHRSRSRSYDDRDRKRRRSNSPRSYRSSRDSHRRKDSYSHKHEKDKYSKRDKDRRYSDSKRSPSLHRGSSKLPKKYRSSRSPSSGSESSRRKSRKYRIH